MNGWKNCILGDVLEEKGYIRGPFGSALKRDEMKKTGIPVYEQANAIYNHRIFRYYIDRDKFSELSRFQVKTNDIIISCSGTVGKLSIIKDEDPKGIISQALLILRANINKIVLDYLYYFLTSKIGFELLTQASHGSVQVNIAEKKVVQNIPLLLPSYNEQIQISSILKSLDDKIDLLHRQNVTLEAMAEALFRQWFVMEDNSSWKRKPLSAIAEYLNGLPCQKYAPQNLIDRLPVLKIRELNSGISEDSDWATSTVPNEYIIHEGDVIFSWSGSLMVKIWNGEDCVLNQHLFKVTSHNYPKWYYYFWTKYHLEDFKIIAESHATTMGHIKRGDLDNAIVLIPAPNELSDMSKTIEPFFNKIIKNYSQIRTLEKLRDTLLPKLMSGEVRVNYSESA